MASIQISSINGVSPYQIYVSDIFGNNTTYLGNFSGTIPPTRFFGLPIIFDSAEYVMLTIIDGFIGESNLYSIHIYNRTLTDAEVLSNYNILKTQFNIP